jgi:mono/diheme cytochrome c family protein
MRVTLFNLSAATFLSVLIAAIAGPAGAQESPQVRQGAVLFKDNCAKCHGADGKGGEGYGNPLWGEGGVIRKFQNAAELYEYNQLMMPFDNPAAINDKEKLAIVAFILANQNVIKRNDVIDTSRAKVIKIPQ